MSEQPFEDEPFDPNHEDFSDDVEGLTDNVEVPSIDGSELLAGGED